MPSTSSPSSSSSSSPVVVTASTPSRSSIQLRSSTLRNNNTTQLVHRAAPTSARPSVPKSVTMPAVELVNDGEKVPKPAANDDRTKPIADSKKPEECDDTPPPDNSTRKPPRRPVTDPSEYFARQSLKAGRPKTRRRFRQQNALLDDLLLAEAEREAVQTTLTIRGPANASELTECPPSAMTTAH